MERNKSDTPPAWLVERWHEEEALRTNSLAERLRQKFFPVLHHLDETLSKRLAERTFFVHDDVTNHPDYQGYDIEIESSIFSSFGWNTIVLEFVLSQLSSKPRLGAWVYWAPGSNEPITIADFGWLDATDTAFTTLWEKTPDLVTTFVAAVERGHP